MNAHTHTENILHLIDVSTNGYAPFALDIVLIISILFAISVIIIKNPISSILSLIALFFSIACYLILLGLTFIGLSYLLVYVGAVSILFLFILMLINVRISELTTNTTNSIPLVILVSLFFISTFSKIFYIDSASYSALAYTYKSTTPFFGFMSYFNNSSLPSDLESSTLDEQLCFVTSKSWDSNLSEAVHIMSIGNVLYTSYSIWLLITSVVLLLAMVGCIVITIKDTVNKAGSNYIVI